jgi:hypothetical protein
VARRASLQAHPRLFRQFLEDVFSEVAQLGAYQAAHYPYHQPHGPILAQLLLTYQCVPRLEAQS